MARKPKPDLTDYLLPRAMWLAGKLERFPSPRQPDGTIDWRPHQEAVAALQNQLLTGPVHPASHAEVTAVCARLSMLGITATSTGGFVSACWNWIAAAKKKASEGTSKRSILE